MKNQSKNTMSVISPTGWWIAGLLMRPALSDRGVYWNNYRLIRAEHWREAYSKARTMGQDDAEAGRAALGGSPEFLGVTDLLPIYEPFEDGAEVLWQEYEGLDNSANQAPLETYSEEEMAAVYEPESLGDH